ncbi:putative quinol monooxygenase [Flavisphingomonas formosensis]|uniref:putative quinol monooxygenase n=1 Tax=Flavisphingomonas formosensis TaxID=861534 RepID=UPI0012FA25A8|nr:antibiotic biosynthesis monooxygenase family protein [Sphingomonas formosensis]
MSVNEIAHIRIAPENRESFEAAVAEAVPLFRAAQGCRGMRLDRSIEELGAYMLVVAWDTVEDHMVHFRESPAFDQWRGLVGGYFAAAPQVGHVETAVAGF